MLYLGNFTYFQKILVNMFINSDYHPIFLITIKTLTITQQQHQHQRLLKLETSFYFSLYEGHECMGAERKEREAHKQIHHSTVSQL